MRPSPLLARHILILANIPDPTPLTTLPATCFFLGILFATFPYDYYVLWAKPPTPVPAAHAFNFPSLSAAATEPYLTRLESHLRFLASAPKLITRILHLVIGVGLVGLIAKLYRPTEANMLFDGASLVLYMCGITVYIANIAKGVRAVADNLYAETYADGTHFLGPAFSLAAPDAAAADPVADPRPAQALLGNALGSEGDLMSREDTLKVLAASNTILALVLVGVLVLQAGQWYAQKKETAEMEEMDRVAAEKKGRREEGKSTSGTGANASSGGAVAERRKDK